MLQNNQPRRNFRSFRAAVTCVKRPEGAKQGGISRELIYRAIVERHVDNHTGLPLSAKACPLGHVGSWQGGSRRPKHALRPPGAGACQSGREPMRVALDESTQNRASRPAEIRPAQGIAPVSAAGSNAMRLKFEIQPTASPTPEKERSAKLVDPGFGR